MFRCNIKVAIVFFFVVDREMLEEMDFKKKKNNDVNHDGI